MWGRPSISPAGGSRTSQSLLSNLVPPGLCLRNCNCNMLSAYVCLVLCGSLQCLTNKVGFLFLPK